MRAPRRTATRCSWSVPANAINATLYDKLSFNFIRDIAPVAGIVRRADASWRSTRRFRPRRSPSSSPTPRPIRASSTWRRPATARLATCRRRAVQDDGRRRHAARALSRRGAGADRPARRAGAGLCSTTCPTSIEHIRAGKLRPLAVTSAARSAALPELPTVGEFVPGYEVSAWYGVGAPKGTPAEIVDQLNRRSMPGSPTRRCKARLADLGGTVLAGRRPTSASSSPRKPRSGAR